MLTVKNEKQISGKGGKSGFHTASIAGMVRENLHYNLGTLLLGLLVMFFNYPIFMALSLSEINDSLGSYMARTTISSIDGPTSVFYTEKITEYGLRMSSTANGILSGKAGLMMLIVPVAAILCARAMFNYVMNRPTADFYFSQPVSRNRRFLSNYLSGALIMLICTLAGFLSSLIVALCFGVKNIQLGPAIVSQLGLFLVFLILYTTVIMAMLLCGRPFAAVAAVIVINGIGLALYSIVMVYYNFFDTFVEPETTIWEKLFYTSPIYYLVRFSSEINDIGGVLSASSVKFMVLMAVLVILLVFAAMLLHRARPAEACGRTLAFSVTRLPLRVILSITGGLLMSFLGIYQRGLFWVFFFMIIGTLIVHAICEIVISMDIRKLFMHKAEALICTVLGLGFMSIFVFDPFGYDRYVPNIADVASVAFSYNGYFEERNAIPLSDYEYSFVSSGEDGMRKIYSSEYYENYPELIDRMAISDEKYIAAVLDMADCGALKASGINMNLQDTVYYIEDEDETTYYVNMVYRLKSGKEVRRQYRLSSGDIEAYMPAIFPSIEYKEAMYPILKLDADELAPGRFGIEYADSEKAEGQFLRARISGYPLATPPIASRDWDSYGKVYDISDEGELDKELLSALQEDLREMEFSDYHEWMYDVNAEYDEDGNMIYSSDSPYYKGEQEEGTYLVNDLLIFIPPSSVKLRDDEKINIVEESWDGSRIDYYDYRDVYPIFESFTHVREVLEKRDILS